jgi:hypothetical protein
MAVAPNNCIDRIRRIALAKDHAVALRFEDKAALLEVFVLDAGHALEQENRSQRNQTPSM